MTAYFPKSSSTMHGLRGIAFLSVLMAATAFCRIPSEYFIAVDGHDANDGLTPATALASLQAGVDVLLPGDTLTIMPGEYLGHARSRNLGNDHAVTVIRAAIPGTAVIRGDIDGPAFEPLPGYRFVYFADFDGQVHGVNELDTLGVYREVVSVGELETNPGCFYHDADSGRLFISTSDARPACEHRFSICVIPDHGLHLAQPRQVYISGLDFRGFQRLGESHRHDRAGNANYGLFISDGFRCVIHDCRAYFNNRGIGMSSAGVGHSDPCGEIGNNVIHYCRAWANRTIYGWGGAINVLSPRYDQIRHCTAFHNSRQGIRMYQGDHFGLTYRNLAWGNDTQIDLKAHASVTSLRNVGVGRWGGDTIRRRVIKSFVGAIQEEGEQFEDNIILRDLALPPDLNPWRDVDLDVEFADPVNHDFRLQSGSRFRGAAADGGDLGAFEFAGDVVFLAPDGDDEADGLSVAGAWKTMGHAAANLRPGQTLYLLPGTYDAPLVLNDLVSGHDAPLRIVSRGSRRAVLAAGLQIVNCRHVVVEHVDIKGGMDVQGTSHLALTRARLSGTRGIRLHAAGHVRITHNDFVIDGGPALRAEHCTALCLSGNNFAASGDAAVEVDDLSAVRYSDYNTYAAGTTAWKVGADEYAFDDMPHVWERHSAAVAPDDRPGSGPYGRLAGIYRPNPERVVVPSTPELHAVTASTADIEWYSSFPGAFTVGWGTTPAATNTALVYGTTFSTFSLTGLQPRTKYYFRLLDARGVEDAPEDVDAAEFQLASAPLTFTTAAHDREPMVFYAGPEGDDAHDGLTPERPWSTLYHAAAQLRPGDTLCLLEGHYAEQLRVRATGTPQAPITLRAAPGARVVFGADGKLCNWFIVDYKHHVRIDGFYMQGVSGHAPRMFGGAGIRARDARDLRITRCMLDGRGISYSGPLARIYGSPGLLIENSVQIDNMGGMQIIDSPDAVVSHCVFLRSKISPLKFLNRPGHQVRLENSIITDSLPVKANSTLIALGYYPVLQTRNNAYFLRRSGDERTLLGLYGAIAYERSMTGYQVSGREDDPPHPWPEEILRRATVTEWHRDFQPQGDFIEDDPVFAVIARHAGQVAEIAARLEGRTPAWRNFDWLTSGQQRSEPLSFHDLFATNPRFVAKGIGLQPAAFDDLP